jgi:hypothetical protein
MILENRIMGQAERYTIERVKYGKKWLRPFGHRSVELHFAFCLQQKCYRGWGLAEGRRQRVVRQIAKIAGIAKIENTRTVNPAPIEAKALNPTPIWDALG